MDWQFIITFMAIALAVGFVLWRSRRVWQSMRGGGCSGGCGCAKTAETPRTQPTLIAPEQLVLRQRSTK